MHTSHFLLRNFCYSSQIDNARTTPNHQSNELSQERNKTIPRCFPPQETRGTLTLAHYHTVNKIYDKVQSKANFGCSTRSSPLSRAIHHRMRLDCGRGPCVCVCGGSSSGCLYAGSVNTPRNYHIKGSPRRGAGARARSARKSEFFPLPRWRRRWRLCIRAGAGTGACESTVGPPPPPPHPRRRLGGRSRDSMEMEEEMDEAGAEPRKGTEL